MGVLLQTVSLHFELFYHKKTSNNIINKAFLFIFRHTIELMLKSNLSIKGTKIPNTHKISFILDCLNDCISKETILNELSILDCYNEGNCFRYVEDKKGKQYTFPQQTQLMPSIIYYITLSNYSSLYTIPFKGCIECYKNKTKENWTFYLNEANKTGQLRTQYDTIIEEITKCVINDEMKIQDIYLPLLFCVRHSLELSYKDNLQSLGSLLPNKDLNKILETHSLCTLHHLLLKYTKPIIDNNINDEEFKMLTQNGIKLLTDLEDMVHLIDPYSYQFRFPVTTKGEPYKIEWKKCDIYAILEKYMEIDSFATFYVDVLKLHGYIETNEPY